MFVRLVRCLFVRLFFSNTWISETVKPKASKLGGNILMAGKHIQFLLKFEHAP